MSLSHQAVVLYASATTLISYAASVVPQYAQGVTISVQNLDVGNYVYIGNNGTSSTSFGFRLSPSQSVSYDLSPFDVLYATCNGVSGSVAITRLFY